MTSSSIPTIRDSLILQHKELINQLEIKYMNYIQEILLQKLVITNAIHRKFTDELTKLNPISPCSINSTQPSMRSHFNEINSMNKEKILRPLQPTTTYNHSQNTKNNNGSSHIISPDIVANPSSERKIEINNITQVSNVPNLKQKRTNRKPVDRRKKYHQCNYSNCNYSTTYNSHLTLHITKKHITKKRETKLNRKHNKYNKHSHLKSDATNKPFKCTECKYASARKDALKIHIRRHTGERPFKCSHCGKGFARKDILTKHIRIHTGERPFKCNHCNYASVTKDALTIHIRTHTGERPFKCQHCERKFNQKHHLKRHLKAKH